MGTKFVRIKPYDPQHGFRTRRYTIGDCCFDESGGWYEVNDEDAVYLQSIRQRLNDPKSPVVFEVCTEAEAQQIDEQEASLEKVRRPLEKARRVSINSQFQAPKARRRRPPRRKKPVNGFPRIRLSPPMFRLRIIR